MQQSSWKVAAKDRDRTQRPNKRRSMGQKRQGWRDGIKQRIPEIKNEEDFHQRLNSAGEKLVTIYNYCAIDDELLPYLFTLRKEFPMVVFMKNDMDKSNIPKLSSAPWIYFYYLGQQVEECSGCMPERTKVKETIARLSKPSTVRCLKKLKRLQQIQQILKLDSIEVSEIIDTFNVKGALDYTQFKESMLRLMKARGVVPQKSGLNRIRELLSFVSDSLNLLTSAKAENLNEAEASEEQKKEVKDLQNILTTLVRAEEELDNQICVHINCGVSGERNSNTLSEEALEYIFSCLFKLFGRGKSDVLGEDIIVGLSIFCRGTVSMKLRSVFEFIDDNKDDRITEAEVRKYVKAIHALVLAIDPSCQTNQKHLDSLASELLRPSSAHGDKAEEPVNITFEEFERLYTNSPLRHLFAWTNIFQPSSPLVEEDDDDDELNDATTEADLKGQNFSKMETSAAAMFVELLKTFSPKKTKSEDGKHIHANTQCSLCLSSPIVGNRYYCMDCEERDENGLYVNGFDLCESCFRSFKATKSDSSSTNLLSSSPSSPAHPLSHEFIELTEPEILTFTQSPDECKLM